MNRLIASIIFLSIISILPLHSQEIELAELTGFPDNLTIKDAKLIDGNLYVAANDELYHFKQGEAWNTIELPENVKVETSFEGLNVSVYNEIFDINEFGQIVMRVFENDDKYLLMTDTSFTDYILQENFTEAGPNSNFRNGSKLFYIGQDSILIPNSNCSDYGFNPSFFSSDAGQTWEELDNFCTPENSDYVRIGDIIYFFGQTFLFGDFGPELFRIGEHQFDVNTLDFSQTAVYDEFQIPVDPTFKYLGFTYIEQDGNITYASDFSKYAVYNGAIDSEDVTLTGSAPGGIMKAGPNNEGLFLIPDDENISSIYYQENSNQDFVELQSNIEELNDVRDILEDGIGGFYVITDSKVYYSDEIIAYDQNISGVFYWDLNSDCVNDASEGNLTNVFMQLEYDDGRLISHYSSDGTFDINVPEGAGVVKYYGYNTEFWEACEQEVRFDLTQNTNSLFFDIGIRPIENCESLNLQAGSGQMGVCFNTFYELRIVNEGTLSSGPNTIELQISEQLEVLNATLPFVDNGDGTFSIQIPEMGLFEEFLVQLELEVSCMATADEVVCIDASIELSDACGESVMRNSYCDILLASYDPNAIKIYNSESVIDTFYDKAETHFYHIDFQNTGNFAAKDVRLECEIPESLDLSTFQFVTSSHDAEIDFRNSRTLVVNYENINLPDSTSNLIGSQGFFKYSLKPIEEVEEDEKIYSHANIFFDFNAPIRTNDALAWIDKILSTEYAANESVSFSIYPNPSFGKMYIDGLVDDSSYAYQIIGLSGKELGVGVVSSSSNVVDVEQLNDGVYFLKISSGQGDVQVLKVVKY